MIAKKKLAQKLGIARSTLYYRSKLKIKDEKIKQDIVEVMAANPAYGYRRVARELKENHKKILRVMGINGLRPRLCRRKWPGKKGDIGLPPAQYVNEIKNLAIADHNIVWAADFTYIGFRDRFIYWPRSWISTAKK